MKQIDAFTYEVVKGEKVTFIVTPNGAGEAITVGVAGKTVPRVPNSDPPSFAFEVKESPPPPIKLVAIVRGEFHPGDTAQAFYKVEVSGSIGGKGPFDGDRLERPPSNQADQADDADYTFTVKA